MRFDEEFLVDGMPIIIPDEGVMIAFRDVFSEESTKDEAGYMHPIFERSDVMSVSLGYEYVKLEEYQYMESLFLGKTSFNVDFRNPKTGNAETRICYRPESPEPKLLNRKTGLFSEYFVEIEEL